jgi:DMSO/TMAO reductase YedYZ heme-binding membrane subunit
MPGLRLRQLGAGWLAAMDGRRAFASLAVAFAAALTCIAVAASVTGLLTARGAALDQAVVRFLLVYSGQATLVVLTVTMVLGVLATDRLLLRPRTRAGTQLAHRATAMLTLGFGAVHVILEIIDGRAGVLSAAVPFSDAGDRYYLSLGTIAADIVVVVTVTSLTRVRYAATARAARQWRVIHGTTYIAWPLAIAHGLYDQHRPAAPVGWSYAICAALVALAVVTRLIAAVQAPPGAGGLS